MKKATRRHLKIHNYHLILKTIYNADKISRADIARLTGLTRTTVSDGVAKLIADGFVNEVGLGGSVGGKRPIQLSLVEDARCFIGIDLADNEFHGALVNLREKIKHRFSLPVNEQDGDASLALVYQLIDKLIALADSPIVGVGIGTPGLIDVRRGIVSNAVNLDWHNLALGDLLKKRYGLPVYICNDCQAAALGEFTFGNNHNFSNLLVIKVSRGTGAGIVLNRHLYYGDGFGAGEIGHVVMVENGEPCRCGNQGCLETVTCNRYIISRAQEIAKNNHDSALHRFAANVEKINMDTVSRAFADGDNALRLLIADVGRHLGMAVSNLVAALNIQHIVIAGNVACFGQALLEPIRQEVKQRSLKTLADEIVIEISNLGSDIVVLGAAALPLKNELQLP